jgi:hypothetical protein
MKVKIMAVLFLFCLVLRAYPDWRNMGFGFGSVGVGFSSDNKEGPALRLSGNFFEFMYQFDNGINLKISPLYFATYGEYDLSLIFINTSFYYDFLESEYFILGPFAAVNALKYKSPDFFEVQAGVTFAIHNLDFSMANLYTYSMLGFDFLVIKAGYKYNNKNGHGFFAFIGLDLLTTVYAYVRGHKEDEAKNYQREHPVYRSALGKPRFKNEY